MYLSPVKLSNHILCVAKGRSLTPPRKKKKGGKVGERQISTLFKIKCQKSSTKRKLWFKIKS